MGTTDCQSGQGRHFGKIFENSSSRAGGAQVVEKHNSPRLDVSTPAPLQHPPWSSPGVPASQHQALGGGRSHTARLVRLRPAEGFPLSHLDNHCTLLVTVNTNTALPHLGLGLLVLLVKVVANLLLLPESTHDVHRRSLAAKLEETIMCLQNRVNSILIGENSQSKSGNCPILCRRGNFSLVNL